ncbi:DUF998 domain-containing protein [Mucilaginibacter sp. SMC90]|uniref:DUF998 domain-containing protein n=1 Tax=Mucilaginibacter sp. SMC90 TaxID=2929803 RepID=UPI001FB22B8A|nr:DUF998 domain-containing protein [Mucilaginibacter sp. SMC90]UOE50811.1 DUF998 domain-containing protein [Mucilaginibacter sp. SMC90]
MDTKPLLYTGTIIPIVFWLSTLIGGFVHGNYNHISNTISELGAIGTKSETLMETFTMLTTVLSVFFMAGLFIACSQLKLNILPIFGVIGFPVMFGWAAIFHSGNPLHSASGPVFLLIYVGALLAGILWRGEDFRQIRKLSLLSLGIMLLIFIRFIPSATIQNNYTGLIQRLAHLGWSVWFTSLSICFVKLLNNKQKQLK